MGTQSPRTPALPGSPGSTHQLALCPRNHLRLGPRAAFLFPPLPEPSLLPSISPRVPMEEVALPQVAPGAVLGKPLVGWGCLERPLEATECPRWARAFKPL